MPGARPRVEHDMFTTRSGSARRVWCAAQCRDVDRFRGGFHPLGPTRRPATAGCLTRSPSLRTGSVSPTGRTTRSSMHSGIRTPRGGRPRPSRRQCCPTGDHSAVKSCRGTTPEEMIMGPVDRSRSGTAGETVHAAIMPQARRRGRSFAARAPRPTPERKRLARSSSPGRWTSPARSPGRTASAPHPGSHPGDIRAPARTSG